MSSPACAAKHPSSIRSFPRPPPARPAGRLHIVKEPPTPSGRGSRSGGILSKNVVGFLQSRGGKDFETALLALNQVGYTVDAFILNAVHWVAQSRARLFAVAKANHIITDGTPFAMETDGRPDALFTFINTHHNIRWDIRELPRLPKPAHLLKDIVEDLPDDDPHWWNRERAEYSFSQFSEHHLMAGRLMLGQKTYHYATAFRRVRNGKSWPNSTLMALPGAFARPEAAARVEHASAPGPTAVLRGISGVRHPPLTSRGTAPCAAHMMRSRRRRRSARRAIPTADMRSPPPRST